MSYVKPEYSKIDVNRAGKVLCLEDPDLFEWQWAYDVLTNWRACHGYPINTFQALLRMRTKVLDKNAIVAQRLKRAPSVIAKLHRFSTMKLSQMQDIGGLRAVVSSIPRVRKLEYAYKNSSFNHELVSHKDYINKPKSDGYRSIHMVYRYNNDRVPQYDGLLLELQFRSKLQHAWATAVETMGTFLGQALKSGQGERAWRHFFEVASAAFAAIEETAPVPGFESQSKKDIFSKVAQSERDLRVLHKLQGFSIATSHITAHKGTRSYHLVILDSSKRTVTINPYPKTQFEQANKDYAKIEERAQGGEQLEAVLVSAGPVEALKKAYPNYFLDTHQFVMEIGRIIAEARSHHSVRIHAKTKTTFKGTGDK